MHPSRVSIKEIARLTGVSEQMVSRVLSGVGVEIKPKERAAVLAAARKLGYQPNLLAQRLRHVSTAVFGVLAPELGSNHFAPVLHGIEREFAARNRRMALVVGGNAIKTEVAGLKQLAAMGVAGIVAVSTWASDSEIAGAVGNIPVIRILRPNESSSPQLAGLNIHEYELADRDGAHQAVTHLLALGHRKIAHFPGESSQRDSLLRLAGYKDALRNNGIEFDDGLVIPGRYTEESGARRTDELLRRRNDVTAIFAGSDEIACGVLHALAESDWRVPEDISVVGFRDRPDAPYFRPPLTTVRQPLAELGAAAAAAVADFHIEWPPPSPLGPPQLMVRRSCGPARH